MASPPLRQPYIDVRKMRNMMNPAPGTGQRRLRDLVQIGALVLTPLVWPVGVAPLWSSSAWNRRDKLVGSLVTPGGLLLPWLMITTVRRSCPLNAEVSSCETSPTYYVLHPTTTLSTPGSPAFDHVFGGVVVLLLTVLPLLTAIHLAYRRSIRRVQAAASS